MALYQHENFGNVQRFIFMKGIITSVDSENDLADVTIPGASDGSGVPLFYHCTSDSEERSNGAIEGAASAFGVDDEVICMYDVEDNIAVRIIGFVDGIKKCGGVVIVTSGEYCFVWNIATGALATNVFINNAVPPDYDYDIDPEYVTEWPYHYLQTEHAFGPDLLSAWKGNLEAWEGWETMYSQASFAPTEFAPEPTITGYSSYNEDDELIGYGGVTTYAQTNEWGWAPRAGNRNQTETVVATCGDESSSYSKISSGNSTTHQGYSLKALNGSEEIIEFYAEYAYDFTYDETAETLVRNGTRTDTLYAGYALFPTESKSGSYIQNASGADCSYYTTNPCGYHCHSGSWALPTYTNWEALILPTIRVEAFYNPTDNCIFQTFAGRKIDGVAVTFYGFGTSNTGISNVVDTDDEAAILPSTLEENTALSDALKALIEASETIDISAIFGK